MNWLSLNFYDKFCVAGIMSCSSLLFSSERFITKWARKGPYFTPLKKQQHQNGMERHTSDKAIYDIVMFRVNMWQFIGQWTQCSHTTWNVILRRVWRSRQSVVMKSGTVIPRLARFLWQPENRVRWNSCYASLYYDQKKFQKLQKIFA